jgi:hypothetical protein
VRIFCGQEFSAGALLRSRCVSSALHSIPAYSRLGEHVKWPIFKRVLLCFCEGMVVKSEVEKILRRMIN